MKPVSSQSNIEKHKASDEDVRDALSRLGAAVLRIAAGRGRPEELQLRLCEVIDAFAAYFQVHGHHVPPDMISNSFTSTLFRERTDAWGLALNEVLRGSLRMVASSLEGDATQWARSSDLMMQGIRRIERIRKEKRDNQR